MINIKVAHCLDTPPKELEINVDTIYKRFNIESIVNNEDRIEYIYQEKQYPIIDYLKEIMPENEECLGELSMLLAEYQLQTDLAIAELSMAIGGGSNNV